MSCPRRRAAFSSSAAVCRSSAAAAFMLAAPVARRPFSVTNQTQESLDSRTEEGVVESGVRRAWTYSPCVVEGAVGVAAPVVPVLNWWPEADRAGALTLSYRHSREARACLSSWRLPPVKVLFAVFRATRPVSLWVESFRRQRGRP